MATTARSPAQGMSVEDFKKFRPTCGFIVVERESPPTAEGSILLVDKTPDQARKVPTPARIVRLGDPDRCPKSDRPIPFSVREGERVMIDAYAGHDLELSDGRRYVLITEVEIVCVIDDDVVSGQQTRTPLPVATE